jgi:RNA polymerase sigma-70 factor, ECF subfamily
MLERKHEELARELRSSDDLEAPDLDAALDDDIGDDLLRLIFTCCHPVLSTEARVALTLRLLGGLTTEEIAAPSSTRADHRAAHRARQAHARRGARALRGAARGRAGGAAGRRCWR